LDQKFTKVMIIVIGLCLVLSLGFNFPRCAAQNSWSDDFSDGEYSGWTVMRGTFNASNHIFETTGEGIGLSDFHSVRHSSEVAYGNWSLDMYMNGTEQIGYWISFIADSLFEYGALRILMPQNGYAIWIHSTGPAEVGLERWTNGDYEAVGGSWFPPTLNGWQNITITRDLTGTFTVSINGTTGITETDNTHTFSHNFGWTSYPWSAIDNVVVNELEVNTTTNGTTPPIPGFPVLAIAVGISTALIIGVLYRRRYRQS
jgi:hypothetical protein